MVSAAKLCMLKLVPKLKTNKSLKLLLADMKANCSLLMRLEMAGIAQNKYKIGNGKDGRKKKILFSLCVPQ